MSRTYRRKNTLWNAPWQFSDYKYVTSKYGGEYLEKFELDKNSKEYRKRLNIYQSDKERYSNGVPHWYVNTYCERPLRSKTRQALIKWKSNPERYDAEVPQFVRNAGWYWY